MRTNLSDTFTPAEIKATGAKIVARNTFKRTGSRGQTIYRLHNTDIVTIRADGSAVYNTGGWRSITTRDRINTYGPFKVQAIKGEWFIVNTPTFDAALLKEVGERPAYDSPEYESYLTHWRSARVIIAENHTIPFYDGIILPQAFRTANPDGIAQAAQDAALRKQIKAYAAKYKEGFPDPSSGDCWFCAMRTTPGDGQGLDGAKKVRADVAKAEKFGLSLGDASGDVNHLREHISEGYVMGSLAFNALAEGGVAYPDNALRFWGNDRVAKAVKNYLCRRLGVSE